MKVNKLFLSLLFSFLFYSVGFTAPVTVISGDQSSVADSIIMEPVNVGKAKLFGFHQESVKYTQNR